MSEPFDALVDPVVRNLKKGPLALVIAVRKGDSIKEDFNKALSEIRSNGELARLEQQNFGQ